MVGLRRPSRFSKDFSETTGPIAVKFHIQPPGKKGKKVFTFGPGHMTKVASMLKNAQNLKKSSPEPLGRLS